ncbi:hypothetical protein AGLY_005387 [Aphis glycines]|uniref:Uncharacterized protein n=1 Tax=Aphis glycines TaxID=307491 RepID=A0A6G0TTU1_APHGL|nr:hypothetical protein AGLY_005387 [Aphis glycines]
MARHAIAKPAEMKKYNNLNLRIKIDFRRLVLSIDSCLKFISKHNEHLDFCPFRMDVYLSNTDTYNNITETIYIEHFKTEHGLRRRFKPSRYLTRSSLTELQKSLLLYKNILDNCTDILRGSRGVSQQKRIFKGCRDFLFLKKKTFLAFFSMTFFTRVDFYHDVVRQKDRKLCTCRSNCQMRIQISYLVYSPYTINLILTKTT